MQRSRAQAYLELRSLLDRLEATQETVRRMSGLAHELRPLITSLALNLELELELDEESYRPARLTLLRSMLDTCDQLSEKTDELRALVQTPAVDPAASQHVDTLWALVARRTVLDCLLSRR